MKFDCFFSTFLFGIATSLGLAACAGGGSTPPPMHQETFPVGTTVTTLTTADRISGGPCSVSTDGLIYYSLPSGTLPAIDFTHVSCTSPGALDAGTTPPIPSWARPSGSTQTIFVATSLQEAYSPTGMQAISQLAISAHVPVTWMIGNAKYLMQNGSAYNALHAQNGDDVELEDQAGLYALARQTLPWYAPAVSIEGAGHERNIPGLIGLGNSGFWGITWNSHGTDNTSDLGAPWGTYCADTSSYKRPSPTGSCSLVSFEWTARDLTRAYLADTNSQGYSAEAAFSTDPDDVLVRGGFDETSGPAYVRELADAYAAAGATQPVVMMSQQESIDEGTRGGEDAPLLGALYSQALADGMRSMTLRAALPLAQNFSASPRAIAFPYLPGGSTTAYNGVPFAPATIDYHDEVAGMTFVAGHTLPARLFTYVNDPISTFNHALVETHPDDTEFPSLIGVAYTNRALTFTFQASVSVHIGVALW
jgi:hypothetical protein